MKHVNEFWSSTDDTPLAKISADWAEQASVICWLKIVLLLLPMFHLLLQLPSPLKIIKFCHRLSTFVFVYFYCNLHTYKISLPVNTINIFFTGTTGTTKLRCQLPLFLFYLIGVPVKQKFTFYFIQCNIQGTFWSLALIWMNLLYPRCSIYMWNYL